MKIINVRTQNQYNVIIGREILKNIEYYLENIVKSKKVVIVSDDNVFPIYGNIVEKNLSDKHEVFSYVFKSGEGSKSIETVVDILDFLCSNQISRNDIIIALGGGVTGDLTGFVSSIYLRGVDFVAIPTSLLAMVDSSVGGKTGVNLSSGKNLAGTFNQPKIVLCDIDTLNTLPKENYSDGMSEIIKYGFGLDKELFIDLSKDNIDIEEIIGKCVEIKADLVVNDEHDKGQRQLLNLGHTVGHALEKISNFQISHGNAVAIGMYIITNAMEKNGKIQVGTTKILYEILKKYNIDIDINYKALEIYNATKNDKKSNANKINLIIPNEIGKCHVENTDFPTLLSYIEAGLKYDI